MKLFLFLGSRRGYAVLQKLIQLNATITGIMCLIEDAHEEAFYPRITAIAKEHAIPIFYSSEVKPSGYAAVLQSVQPDIAFAIGWRYLITEAAWRVPPRGTLIIHDSLLPQYRGFAPMNWAIINGETQTGVTLFHIDGGVDSGPIVDQLATDITLQDTAKTVDEKVILLYEKIIEKNLSRLASGNVMATPQDESIATYCCKRTPEDGEIDWRKTAVQIFNQIRGLSHPFPGAFTTWRGKRLVIWEAALPERREKYVGHVPGRLLGKREGRIEVLTGEGVLCLSRLQYENEPEQEAQTFSISVKDTLGR